MKTEAALRAMKRAFGTRKRTCALHASESECLHHISAIGGITLQKPKNML